MAAFSSEFTISELEKHCPGVGRELIRHRLKALKTASIVQCIGRGPGAKWQKRGNKF